MEESDEYSSDEEVRGVKKWMPIEIPENFDPNKAPSTGEEYLHFVMYEAKKCQTVVTADINISKFDQNKTYRYDAVKGCAKASEALLPTQEWQKQKVAEFAHFHKYIQLQLPRRPDRDECDHSYWVKKMDLEYPDFSVVSGFHTKAHLILLQLIITKLSNIAAGATISDTLGCWVYAILSIQETPISPDMCSELRELARQCAVIRSRLSSNAPAHMYKHLNFFICIIAVFFKQFDLADSN